MQTDTSFFNWGQQCNKNLIHPQSFNNPGVHYTNSTALIPISLPPAKKYQGLHWKKHNIWLPAHVINCQIINWKYFTSQIENFSTALGNAPSGMNTLRAFITRFMATKSFHPWFTVLFSSGQAGTGFYYNFSSICALDKLDMVFAATVLITLPLGEKAG